VVLLDFKLDFENSDAGELPRRKHNTLWFFLQFVISPLSSNIPNDTQCHC